MKNVIGKLTETVLNIFFNNSVPIKNDTSSTANRIKELRTAYLIQGKVDYIIQLLYKYIKIDNIHVRDVNAFNLIIVEYNNEKIFNLTYSPACSNIERYVYIKDEIMETFVDDIVSKIKTRLNRRIKILSYYHVKKEKDLSKSFFKALKNENLNN